MQSKQDPAELSEGFARQVVVCVVFFPGRDSVILIEIVMFDMKRWVLA